MPFDVSAGSFAATAIMALFWWTVLSPLILLTVAVVCPSHLRTRVLLMLATLVPPILALLPIAAMQGGLTRAGAAGAVVLEGAGIAFALVALAIARRRPERAARCGAAALGLGVGGGMLGSAALVAALFVF